MESERGERERRAREESERGERRARGESERGEREEEELKLTTDN